MNATTLPKTRIKALLVLLLLTALAVGFTVWRFKLPLIALISAFRTSSTAPTAPASVPLKSGPSVETPAAPAVDHTAQVIVLGYHRFVDKVRHLTRRLRLPSSRRRCRR